MPAQAVPWQPALAFLFGLGSCGHSPAHCSSAEGDAHCSTPVPPTLLEIKPSGTFPPSECHISRPLNQQTAEKLASEAALGSRHPAIIPDAFPYGGHLQW